MAFGDMEVGLRHGLAVRLPWEQTMQADRYANQLKNQNKLLAEQKSKLFADDFKYNNAMNSHDNPLVKEFAMKKLQETGAFLRDNPDWETNPVKRAQYNTMIHDLKDNPDLNRGLLSDANFKNWQDYMKNPKNADIVNDPEFQKINQHWDNYTRYGNQFGEEAARTKGKQAFMFIPPDEMQDYTEYLRKIAGDTEFDSANTRQNGYQIVNKQSVSDVSRAKAASMAMSGPMAKWIKKDYEKKGGDEKFGNIQNFVRQNMDPFFKGDKYDYNMVPDSILRASASAKTAPTNWWADDTKRAFEASRQGGFIPVTIARGGAEEMLMDRNGNYNLSGGQIINPKTGNFIPVNDLTTKYATSSGARMAFKSDPSAPGGGRYMISTRVKLPTAIAEKMLPTYIDAPSWFGLGLSSTEIVSQGNDMFAITRDDAGKETIEFEVWKPIDNSTQAAGVYNFGLGGSKEKTTSETAQYRIGVDPDTGKKWYMDESGNAVKPVE